jgi:hypothetical protein
MHVESGLVSYSEMVVASSRYSLRKVNNNYLLRECSKSLRFSQGGTEEIVGNAAEMFESNVVKQGSYSG